MGSPEIELRRFVVAVIALLIGNAMVSAADPSKFTAEERNHWAFQSVKRPAIPSIENLSLRETPLDAFVSTKLQTSGLTISPEADKATLQRRVTFDLVGLPPSPTEAADFLADESPDAYERLVDRLLANPHHGEAWGRMWLDAVRFAETAGFNADPARPLAYKYRDYVIRATNRDLPYDRFLQEQIAGDELFPDDPEALIATGYCRMWADESNASNIHLARQLALNDLTGNVGAVVLGLSVGCAQCHDHKFDPLSINDFYQLQAFFSGIVLEDQLPVGSHEQIAEYRGKRQEWLDQTASLRHELHDIERKARIKMAGDRRMKFPADVLAAIDCLPEERTTMQRQLAFWSERQMEYKNDDLPKHLSDEEKARRDELLKQLAEARQSQPKPSRELNLMAVAELSTEPPKTFLLSGGSYDKPLDEVVPQVPAILRTATTQTPPSVTPPSARSSGRRSALARWLTSPDQLLTYRVWVNRVWQGHFGRGLVDNANDFGMQSAPPTHPELLDWLTSEFASDGYAIKKLHRKIVLSASYRQKGQPADASITPSNLYSFYPRRRLSSERIRDAWLVASGTLNDTMYGPGVRPELPPGMGGAGGWKVSDPPDRTRRSLYIYAKRNLPYPMMAAFDFPDMHESCGCRSTTTIAPQALMLLNSGLIVNAAKQLSQRCQHEANTADPSMRVQRIWQVALGRNPDQRELDAALNFVAHQHQLITEGRSPKSESDPTASSSIDEDEAFSDLCHTVLNTNEFLFVD